MPLLMKVFWPFSTISSPDSTAVVFIAARSLPVFGSVMAIAVMTSPETQPGRYLRFCSSEAKAAMYGTTTSVWSPAASPEWFVRIISSLTMTE